MELTSTHSATRLIKTVFKQFFPLVEAELAYWREQAAAIPNPILRKQALSSIDNKAFHCQGGSVYAILTEENWEEAIQFIVAFQTISDYLDNLCDRSTTFDPDDFRSLHQAMFDAIEGTNDANQYYQYRPNCADGGYLENLVRVCQKGIIQIPQYQKIKPSLVDLVRQYIHLQVDKHVKPSERVARLKQRYQEVQGASRGLAWYEYAAATGSTLGVFCLVCYGLKNQLDHDQIQCIYDCYFPYLQGLHILLDYFIDQQEDIIEGDLNFCSYYPSNQILTERLVFFITKAISQTECLPSQSFHKLICQGLTALYLADPKVSQVEDGTKIRRHLLKIGGWQTRFFHYSIRYYYRFKNKPIAR